MTKNNKLTDLNDSPKRKKAHLALILNAIIWGAALPIVKPALEFVSPIQFLFFRYLIASFFSIPIIIYLLIKHKPSIKMILSIVVMEAFSIVLGHAILYEGLNRTTSLEASLIASTSPIFITLGGIFFLKEKEDRNEWIGLLIAILGTLLIIFDPVISGNLKVKSFSLLGNALVLGYVAIWTIYMLLAKKIYKTIPKSLIGFISVWVGVTSFYFLTSSSLPDTSNLFTNLTLPSVFFAATYMGILGSIVAVPAIIYGNNRIEASEASLFSYLQPLVYIPLSVLWLKESITPTIIVALVLIAIGVYTAERRKPKLTPIQ